MKFLEFLKVKINLYFLLSIVFAIIPAALMPFVPFASFQGDASQKILASILAPAIWLSVISEIVMTILCSRERKLQEDSKPKNKYVSKSYPGVISFFKNTEGMIADIVLFVSLIAIIILVWTKINIAWLILSSVSVLYLSFNAHCLLNGKNYKYIKLSNHKKEHEKNA